MLSKIKSFLTSYRTIALCDILALITVFIFSGVLLLDELEHLHAAYFISTGSMPFRDFFEHHHPLFLFLLAPLIKIMPQNAILTLYTARVLMTFVSIGTFYYTYKIAARFLGGKFCAILSILVFLSFYPSLYMFSIVKPDTLMRFFFVCGLYYFFEYTQTLKAKPLIISTASLTLSFLFLQTAVFLIIPLVFVALYLFYKNPKQIKNFLYAAILPFLFIGIFTAYLYLTDSLIIYFQSCWIFNAKFFSFLDFKLPSVLPDFIIYIIMGYIAYGYTVYNQKANFYIHTIAFLLSFSLIRNFIYPVYYPRYLLASFFYTSLLIASAVKDAPKIIHTYLKLSLIAILSINLIITFTLYSNISSLNVLNKIKPSDTCFNYFSNEQNIYQPRYSYYWYAPSIESVDNYLFNRQPEYNINNLVKSQKFKYILYNKIAHRQKCPKPFPNTEQKFKETYRRHTLDNDILTNYEFIGIDNIGIYKLKSN